MGTENKDLIEYLKLIWPILEYCTKYIINDDGKPVYNRESDKHIWYLYRQAFYGFFNVLNKPKQYYSKGAELEFNRLIRGTSFESRSLSTINWNEQVLFDKGRKHLLIEHMYTGSMFRLNVRHKYNEGALEIDSVCKIVEENYKVCWITKCENQRLHKTKREGDLIEYYASKEIYIANITQ